MAKEAKVHYEKQGKSLCPIKGEDIKLTTNKREITCGFCKRFLSGDHYRGIRDSTKFKR